MTKEIKKKSREEESWVKKPNESWEKRKRCDEGSDWEYKIKIETRRENKKIIIIINWITRKKEHKKGYCVFFFKWVWGNEVRIIVANWPVDFLLHINTLYGFSTYIIA